MLEQDQITEIKDSVGAFFNKMTIEVYDIEVKFSSMEKENIDVIDLNVKISEPQIIIGQQGQTLFEIQRLLRSILNKKLKKVFFLNLDIDDYKKKKIDYLRYLANDSADHVAATNEEKNLLPMSSYERRIIHAELSQRTDITTESRGEGAERHIVIKPKQ